ncbi:MAG: hypothetical protein C5B47_03630 [Verrucomicrobia bacterium]|nr:MAG: hypothetical protein C5B47_03630 [Verrucomicrobiota bacterium]
MSTYGAKWAFLKSMRHLVDREARLYFEVMAKMKALFSLHEMAETFEVSKSSFYAHMANPNCLRRGSDEGLT